MVSVTTAACMSFVHDEVNLLALSNVTRVACVNA
jgi:hypothetical protein